MSTAATPAGGHAPYAPPALTTWGIIWRYVVAGLIGLYLGAISLSSLGTLASGRRLPWVLLGVLETLDVLGLITALILIRFRRRQPLRVMWVMAAISVFSPLAAGFVVWAYVALCTRLRWREIIPPAIAWNVAGLAWGAGYLAVTTGGAMAEPRWLFGLLLAIIVLMSIASTAVYTMIGIGVGNQRRDIAVARERAEQAEREQALRVAQGKSAERQRIAREMHDVVAHRISLVAMHAGALGFRTDLEPERMREVARGIQENANAALTELRAVLADLREDDQPTGPQPALTDLPTLLDELETQGMRMEVHLDAADVGSMPSMQSRHAYRIVQEALTNARKHAVNAPVWLRLTGGPEAGLTISVRNPRTYSASVPGSGMGLVGLRERAELAGGRLVAGPDSGDFLVEAWLPWSK